MPQKLVGEVFYETSNSSTLIALWDNSAIRLWHSYIVCVCLTRLTPPPAMSVSELKQIISAFVIVCGVLAAVIMAM